MGLRGSPALCWTGYCELCMDQKKECRSCKGRRVARELSTPPPESPVFWCGLCHTNYQRRDCRACAGNRHFLGVDGQIGAMLVWYGYCTACAAADVRRERGGCRFCDKEDAPVGPCPDCGQEGHLWKWCPGRGGASRCLYCGSRGHCVDMCFFGPDERGRYYEEDCPARQDRLTKVRSDDFRLASPGHVLDEGPGRVRGAWPSQYCKVWWLAGFVNMMGCCFWTLARHLLRGYHFHKWRSCR